MICCNSCILAVDAGGTSLKAALVPSNLQVGADLGLVERTFFSVFVDSNGTKDEILDAYKALGSEGAALAAREHLRISHVVVCIPGPFDYAKGQSLMKHKYQAVYGIPLGPQMIKGVGYWCSISFLHDSTAFLLGATQSISEKKQNVCGVIIGTGLGFAYMIDGKIQESPSGGPAISIYARPYLKGTSEDYVSKRGILRKYQDELQNTNVWTADMLSSRDKSLSTACCQTTVAEIADRARDGDPIARETFTSTAYHLGQILLPILREHHFDTILLGGAISKSADLFLPELCQILDGTNTAVYQADDIDLAPIIGAAYYVIHYCRFVL